MPATDKTALALTARQTALAIVYDIIDDIAYHGILNADANDYRLEVETKWGLGSITFVPGVEPDSVDVVLVAANGATARIRGKVFMKS